MAKDEVMDDQENQDQPVTLDLESDDHQASDILEVIERERDVRKPEPRADRSRDKADAAFALESQYFRSFGERPLLTREEEIALAKRIDRGTRGIRKALREAVRLAQRLRKSERAEQATAVLNEVRMLSGLSAPSLDRALVALSALRAEALAARGMRHRAKQFESLHAEVKACRRLLEEGKDELVRYNLRLVVDIAKHYNGRGLALLDLVQEGNIGLMKAAERYQHRKGFKFSTYATWWIRQGITRALADQSRTIRIPVHMTESSHRIVRTARRLAQQLGREPRPEEIGKVLQVQGDKIQETLSVFQEPVSLENPIGDGETLLGDLIADRGALSPDSPTHRVEMTRELDRILSTLTPREQTVIRLRFGIGQDEPFTLEQVGQSLSVTRERIRQIEAKALKKLKTPEIKQMFAAIK